MKTFNVHATVVKKKKPNVLQHVHLFLNCFPVEYEKGYNQSTTDCGDDRENSTGVENTAARVTYLVNGRETLYQTTVLIY